MSEAFVMTHVGFGRMQGPYPFVQSKLLGSETMTGHWHIWENLVKHADDQLLHDLLAAMESGTAFSNLILTGAACLNHDGMGSPVTKGGHLKRTARRFIYHSIATIDIASRLINAPRNTWIIPRRKYDPLISNIQSSYYWLTPPSRLRPNSPLSENDSLLANAYCLVAGLHGDTKDKVLLSFIAENFSALEPYLDYIISSEIINRGRLESLLETSPELSLSAGAL